MYVAIIWLCLVSPINDWTGTKQEGVRCVAPQQQGQEAAFSTEQQCVFFVHQVYQQSRMRSEQDKLNYHMRPGAEEMWKVKGECRKPVLDTFLDCQDCNS